MKIKKKGKTKRLKICFAFFFGNKKYPGLMYVQNRFRSFLFLFCRAKPEKNDWKAEKNDLKE